MIFLQRNSATLIAKRVHWHYWYYRSAGKQRQTNTSNALLCTPTLSWPANSCLDDKNNKNHNNNNHLTQPPLTATTTTTTSNICRRHYHATPRRELVLYGSMIIIAAMGHGICWIQILAWGTAHPLERPQGASLVSKTRTRSPTAQ